MAFPPMPSKRPHDWTLTEPIGKGKWQTSAGFYSQNQSLKISPGSIVFRVLCHASKIGSVIGKGGSSLSQIRKQTRAKVRLEETVPGCDERIIVIVGSDKRSKVHKDLGKDGGRDTNAGEDGNDTKEHDEDDLNEEPAPGEDLQSEKGTSSVQKALLLVCERMVKGEIGTNGGDDENRKCSTYVVRLLVLSNQVGCILGKGGSVIKKMSADSGAQIRILPRDKLPACASSSDELVQITGELVAARKALLFVSQQLLENSPWDFDLFSSISTGPSAHSLVNPVPRQEVFPSPSFPYPAHGAPFSVCPREVVDYHSGGPPPIPNLYEGGVNSHMKPPHDIISFRLLCHFEKVGGIIGKGGAIIKTLQLDTGCEIKVLDGLSASEDRIIVISGPAHPDDRISAAQEGVLRVQSRIFKPKPDSFENTAAARLLVSSNQIGCLLGKGGAIIAEMRKSSGARIRIMGKEQVPKCVSEDEEVVQISGEYGAVEEALMQITLRLRHYFFHETHPSINHPFNPAFPGQVPPFPSYMGRRELSPPGMYSILGPSLHKFDVHGGLPPPHGNFHGHDDRPPYMHNNHRPVIHPHMSGSKLSSAPWGPQGQIEGPPSMGFPDYAGVPQRRFDGFGGGQPAIITNTTVEVIVPRSLVPTIYGEDGENLKQVRQISDAKITITEAKPGTTETVIIISGTPEQTHAARSLIQAFVMSGPGPP